MAGCETLVDEGLFQGLTKAIHNYNADDEILKTAMHALYRIGSVDKFVLSVVEYDAPGRVIYALSQHMVRQSICFCTACVTACFFCE
jgi:hypothetical protein